MRFTFLSIVLFFMLFQEACATTDSLKHKQRAWVLTPRFNTLNMAPVSGNIVNGHVNLDFALVYTRNRFMWTIANAVDLEDSHSEMNYWLTNVRYKFSLGKKFGVSPFLAFYSEHAEKFIDPVSDANGGVIFSFQHNALTVEAFVLLVRLTHHNSEKDMINRFEVRYKFQSVVLSGFVFQNTSYFDNKERIAVGFKATLPEFKLFHKVRTRADVTGSFKIHEYPETRNLSGVFLSLAFPMSF